MLLQKVYESFSLLGIATNQTVLLDGVLYVLLFLLYKRIQVEHL
jgi:hypothetical protein